MRRLYPQLCQTLFAWALRQDLVEEQHFNYETECQRWDGTRSPVLLNATGHVEGGFLDRVSGVVYDLLAMESQRVLSIETEQRYQMLFRDSPNGLIQADTNKRILLVNPAFCKLLGYTSEELLRKTTEDITHPDDHLISSEAVRLLWEREVDHYSYEKRYLRKDGSSVWAQLGLSLFRSLDGTPVNFIGQCQDISERKVAEARMQHRLLVQTEEQKILKSQNQHLRDVVSKDSLTLLSNRAAFDTALDRVIHSSFNLNGYGVITIEIGSLALRNRNHGEQAVDELLCMVAAALLRACPDTACTARITGGTFRVLLDACQPSLLQASVSRITAELTTVRWRKGPLSPSIRSELHQARSPRTHLIDAESTSVRDQNLFVGTGQSSFSEARGLVATFSPIA